jgi:hypothetical protein
VYSMYNISQIAVCDRYIHCIRKIGHSSIE